MHFIDISSLFIKQLRDLVTNILSPNRLQAKQHLGRPLTVAAWLDMFEVAVRIRKDLT
jgi:hypothetical protein